MTDAQFARYRESAEEGYARQVAESGEMSWEAAVEKATNDYARILPDGLRTPDQFLFRAYDTAADETAADDKGAGVGMLWLNIALKVDGLQAWVYDVIVDEEHRRRGYGRAIMRAGEELCRSRAVRSIGLNVFGGNAGARALYEQEGYVTTALQMRKRL
ncbi:GNAT family N-acetyltransferase [Actinoplanes sp. NPDC051494]|uniref:GNAT family N-acetyltransferase n=1 Tax=Actinoplanes sp. NPDC051494 TaxID=3363907 RepID=UPI00378BF5DA